MKTVSALEVWRLRSDSEEWQTDMEKNCSSTTYCESPQKLWFYQIKLLCPEALNQCLKN